MSVDLYAICPCGSGKKIKFCKCKDSVSELARVLKMVEGGQVVPALDRLAAILQEHPDAAWALAVRGRLLLDFREYGTLAENAERFIRLQPSNPLALTQRAAAKLFAGDPEGATSSMLEALTESGREVDSFVLDVASVLAFSLAQMGLFLTARVYATLAMMASGYEGNRTALTVLRQMNSAPTINLLLKSVPDMIDRPEDASWGERYDEALTLLRNNKILLAENKFESLQRTAAREPAILLGLLTCAIWRGDADAQSQILQKLSECDSLEFEQRARYLAMSALVQNGMPNLSVDVFKLQAEIENAEQVELAMTADARFVPLPSEMVHQMREDDEEVPPRAGFQLLDRDKPESLDALPSIDEIPEAEAMILVFGKQTDRAARIEVLDVREKDLDDVKSRISAVIEGQELKQELGDPLPLIMACQPPIAMVRFQGKPAEAQQAQAALVARRMPDLITSAKLKLLDNQSLQAVADDDSKRIQRTAVVRIVELYDTIGGKENGVIERVHQLAKIEPRPPLKPDSDSIETIGNEDLDRVDPSDLSAEDLVYLLQRAQQVAATTAQRNVSRRLLEMELTAEQQPAKMIAYMSLINASDFAEKALGYLDEAKKFAEENTLSDASLLLSEVSLRLQVGDGEGFQQAIQSLSTRHGQNPEVMAQLQQMLMSYGLIRPDGSPRQAPPPPTGTSIVGGGPSSEAGSGLWTPESAAAERTSGGEGGSKLWIPGMD